MNKANQSAPTTAPIRSVRGRQVKLISVISAALLTTGCAGSLSHLPDNTQIETPETFAPPSELVKDASTIERTSVQAGWVSTFEDASFTHFAQTALNNNPDLSASAARLQAAVEQVVISGRPLLPNINLSGNGVATENELNNVENTILTSRARLDISWEADVWGRLTQRRKAAALDAKAQGELYRAGELVLVANVGRAWYTAVTNQLQVELAEQRLESFERTASIIEENYQRGLRSALDVYLSRSDVQVQISNLAEARFNLARSVRAFKALLGEYPDNLMQITASLPELEKPIPVGLPAELMERRPDVQAALYQYQSTRASAKAAQRDRLPSITFAGSIEGSQQNFNDLFDNESVVKNLISGIALPVFQSGALRSRAKQAAFQAQAAYNDLITTSLAAFEEVENAITRESTLREQHEALKQAVELAQGGLDLALDRYQSGIEDYQTVLQSQRSVFNSKLNELNIRNALIQNRINLHLALGGDFGELSAPADAETVAEAETETDSLSEPTAQTM